MLEKTTEKKQTRHYDLVDLNPTGEYQRVFIPYREDIVWYYTV